jgi:hypothetical protein
MKKLAESGQFRDHAYLNPDGSPNGEKLLEIVKQDGVFQLMVLGYLARKDDSLVPYWNRVSHSIKKMFVVVLLAAKGDEVSQMQLTAIEKLAEAGKYEVPESLMRKLVACQTNPRLARAWELHALMDALYYVVEWKNPHGPHLPTEPVVLKSDPSKCYGFSPLLEIARKHWVNSASLQSLAMRIYLTQLEEKTDAVVDERTLRRDLARMRRWERDSGEDEKIRHNLHTSKNVPITWCDYSEEWKKQKKTKQQKLGKKRGGSELVKEPPMARST